MLSAFKSWLLKASSVVLALLLLALVTLDFVQVIARYALGTGWPWAGDVSIIMLLLLAWIGAGHLWLAGQHIAVDFIGLAGSKVRRLVDVALGILVIGGSFVLLPMTWKTLEVYGFIDLPALGVSGAAKYYPIAFGIFYVALAAAINLVLTFTANSDREQARGEAP